MAAERLPFRKTRESLRLTLQAGLSQRAIARSVKVSQSTVNDYVGRAVVAKLTWPLPPELDDEALDRLLFAAEHHQPKAHRPEPDWAHQAALPRSGLGKAVGYALTLWDGLVRFVDDARIPIDTNLVERGMRPLAVGRKNHYDSKSERGTRVAAIFYTLIEAASSLAPSRPAMSPRRRGARSTTPVPSRCRAISRRPDPFVARIRGEHRADHDAARDGVRRALTVRTRRTPSGRALA